jgi:cold shock CspA family protein
MSKMFEEVAQLLRDVIVQEEVHASPADIYVFVHFSAVLAARFKSLTEGEEVESEVTRGPKGLQATNVRKR